MANKMAEFPGKLAIFLAKSSLASRGREGGGCLLKISKLRGGYFGNFRSQGGGYFGYTPPLLTPALNV